MFSPHFDIFMICSWTDAAQQRIHLFSIIKKQTLQKSFFISKSVNIPVTWKLGLCPPWQTKIAIGHNLLSKQTHWLLRIAKNCDWFRESEKPYHCQTSKFKIYKSYKKCWKSYSVFVRRASQWAEKTSNIKTLEPWLYQKSNILSVAKVDTK